jgi:methionyl-tRNA formyltransferase
MPNRPMRIAFAGTPPFAATALEHLLDQGFDVAVVLTQPDRPAGRGQKLQASAVKQLALTRGLSVLQPHGLKLDGRFGDEARATQSALQALQLDAMVVVAYGLILPRWILQAPRLGCFNIHASLLPRWRGAAPIQRSIEAGDGHTGVTLMQMDEGLDTGAMLAIEKVAITAEDTAQALHDTLAPVGARLAARVLKDAGLGLLKPVTQPSEGVTYAAKIEKSEAAIDWTQPAEVIERRVRAFDPFPGCTFTWQGETWKLWRSQVWAEQLTDPSKGVAENQGVVLARCGSGVLQLLTVQRPGGRRQDALSALGPCMLSL